MTRTIKITSPVDNSVYAERPIAADAEIDRALAAARAAQADWRKTPLAARARTLKAAVAAMNAGKDEIAKELAWQMGRPVRFGAARSPAASRSAPSTWSRSPRAPSPTSMPAPGTASSASSAAIPSASSSSSHPGTSRS